MAALPTCCLTGADAEVAAERMRVGLPTLNEGRPLLHSTLSRGIYEVRVIEADTLPIYLPVSPPHYE